MLQKHDLETQAEAFLGFAGKSENRATPLIRLFVVWARSKDFDCDDERAIWALLGNRHGLYRARESAGRPRKGDL